MAYNYRPAKGARLTEEQAQRYGEYLFEGLVEEFNGELTAQVILADAARPEAPTHDYFVWDDTDAAGRYRTTQAYYLLRSIHVVVKTTEGDEFTTRAMLPVIITEEEPHPTDDGDESVEEARHVYCTIRDVMSDDDKRGQVIEGALRELNGWRARYKQYSELEQLFHAIEQGIEQVPLAVVA